MNTRRPVAIFLQTLRCHRRRSQQGVVKSRVELNASERTAVYTLKILLSTGTRMGRGENMRPLSNQEVRDIKFNLDEEPLMLRFLRTFRDVLKFILFSYTVLFGSLLLARWTTYFMVGK